MALDFPASPSVNQTYSGPGGVVWVWDGAKWVSGTGSTVYAPVTSPVFLGNPTAPNPPAGDADTSVATTQFVAAAVAPALHDTGRNYIHNPLSNVQQRGVGPWVGGGYTADRWVLNFALDTPSISVVAAVDATRAQIGDESATSLLNNTFTGNAGAGAVTLLSQPIEIVRRLAGKTVTVSFWAAASTNGLKLGVGYDQIFGTGGSPSATVNGNGQSVTLSTTWARYNLTFTLPSASGKTLGTAGNDCTWLNFFYTSGTSTATRAGNIGVQSGTIQLWGVQLEIGSVATPLEKPDPRYDLANCQRFYVGDTTGIPIGFNSWGAGGWLMGRIQFPCTMRATPTIGIGAIVSPSNVSNQSISWAGPNAFNIQVTSVASGATTVTYTGYTASADL